MSLNNLKKTQETSSVKNLGAWFDRRLDPLRIWISENYKTQIAEVESETKERAARNEVAVFAHPLIRFFVFIAALVVFGAVLSFTAPPRGIKKALVGKDYEPITRAEMCIGKGCLDDPQKVQLVELPSHGLRSLAQDSKRELFYRFQIDWKKELRDRGLNTAFFPIPWGEADIYRSGVLVRSGLNVQPVVPLLSDHDEIIINVHRPSGRSFGFGTLYPPFISDANLASNLEKELAGEPFQVFYSFVAQISGLCLLMVMFLAFPYRPELFAFVVLFGTETLSSYISRLQSEGEVVFTAITDQITYNSLILLGGISVIFFIAMFFRLTFSRVFQFFRKNLITIILGLASGYILLTSLFPRVNGEGALFITTWVAACLISGLLVRATFLKLFSDKLWTRVLMGGFAFTGILFWAALNIHDRFNIASNITTEYNNHLHFFFFMATVLGVEIGRTEVKLKNFFSIVPKEIVALIDRRETRWRSGFVVLVDVIGWTEMLMRLNQEETDLYIRKINEYLLTQFDDESNASVINGTGDGFFLTFEGSCSEEKFTRLVTTCRNLATSKPTLKVIGVEYKAISDRRVVVRSAVAYGQYKLELSKAKNLKRDFIAGYLPTLLSRVIGDERSPQGPRVLTTMPGIADSPLDAFRANRSLCIQETKGLKTTYWIFEG